MKIKKHVLAKLEAVYAVSRIMISNKTHLMAASEEHGKCLLFTPPNWSPSVVWEAPGGTMTLTPIPDRPGCMLAIQEFFPVFQSENAGIVYAEAGEKPTEPWSVHRILDLPFVHRVELVPTESVPYLVAATVCSGKAFTDDWSKPGVVYAGVIPEHPQDHWVAKPILEGISKNHGMCVATLDGHHVVLIAGMEGLFSLLVPETPGEAWRYERLLDHEISDLCVLDVDGDGSFEIVTIEPFHGDALAVYKSQSGGWRKIYELPVDFGHVIWAGRILNGPALLAGSRGGAKELALLRPACSAPLILDRIVIDHQVGPTQVTVMHEESCDSVLSANHGTNEVSLYEITE